MARPKLSDPKRPKSVSFREKDLKKYDRAMKKLGCTVLNQFLEMAANDFAERVLQGITDREGPTDDASLGERVEQQDKQIKSLQRLTTKLLKGMTELQASIEEAASVTQ